MMLRKLSLSTALVATGLFIAGAALAVHVTTRPARSSRTAASSAPLTRSSAAAPAPVTVHAAGRGKPFFNFVDGRQMLVSFQGPASAALQSGQASPKALASADLDANGTPDLVAGYSYGGTGIVTVQRGNPDAFAPSDDSVFVRIQQGYNPASLLPETEVYPVPVPADFVVIGNFNKGASKDILIGAKGGGLYLMAGQGKGFGSPEQISLPGPVTSLATGEFRAADGVTDVAVGITGPGGDALLMFDGAEGLSNPLVQYPLAGPASAIEFGSLDDDPFLDVAVAAGSEINVVHGWGRKSSAPASSRLERIGIGSNLRGLALGEFTWDRGGHSEIAALTDGGAVQIVQHKQLDTREFTEAEKATRTRGRVVPQGTRLSDIEALSGWQPGKAPGWSKSKSFATGSTGSTALKPLMKTHLSGREMDEITVIGNGQSKLQILRPLSPNDPAPNKELLISDQSKPDKLRRNDAESQISGDATQVTLDVTSEPIAMLTLPKKINGEQDVVLLSSGPEALSIVPNAPNTTIDVDRTDDPSGAGLTAASACTGAANDCSLRGAVQFANTAGNDNTTINLPANTYILSINGTSVGGCGDNTNGDLGANQTMSIVGAGAATTIIRQTGTGPANDGDRIMCMSENFTIGLVFNFSGVTFTGGRDGAAGGGPQVIGGGGIVGGELNNSLTLTNVVFVNNWTTGPGLGGGGIQITGGNLTITNSTFGGANAPGLYTDRSSVTNANQTGTSGAGVNFTPSSPMHAGGSGILTVTGTTFSRNVANSVSAGGGGADLYIFAFAAPGGIGTGNASFGTTTFNNNSAPTAHGGAFITESLPTTVATTSFTSNSSGNRGGAIYVGGGGLTLNGTSPSITFTGNTATNAGSSVSTAFTVNVDGTNTSIGGDIEVGQGGTWTNNTGSTLAPTNVVVAGGVFVMNNSTMNVSGNLTIGPGGTNGGTFNGNTGTVNIQGNFILNAGGVGPATNLAAGTGTFNFNGTGAQSISNGTAITFFNLTDSNITQPLTLNNSLAVNGTLNVNGANAILSPVAGTVISGTGTLTGTGTARASRTAATPDFLSQYTITNKTLTTLTIDYNGAGNQTVNNTPAYSQLRISGSGIKTLQGNTTISSNLDIIAGSTFSGSTFNFSLGGNWTNGGTFTAGTGTVTFAGTTGIQTLTGNTTFFNLTLNNSGATTNFGSTTTTIGNDLVASAGTMDGGLSTIIFTGVTDNLGAMSGNNSKNFHNLQINSPATISNSSGTGNVTIENNYTNNGTFTQAAARTTTFATDNNGDLVHSLSGSGTTTFGVFTINTGNTVDAGSHSFNVVGATFNVNGTGIFTGNTSTVTFNAGAAQGIAGDGAKNFSGLTINNPGFSVTVINGAGAVEASVSGVLTLTSDLTVSSTGPAILQQSGTSAGAGDVIGTVRRTDLGVTPRSFGNVDNAITINSGTAPNPMDVTLAKGAGNPIGFPATVLSIPRTYGLTPTGGSGISATVKLRYLQSEVGSATESRFILWKDVPPWTPQGGTVDAANNFVSLTGVSSFSNWAIAEGSDLTLTKANDTSNASVTGDPWNWTLTATNTGAPATFTAGQTIISDNLPNSNVIYGTPTVQNATNITGSANISCSIVSNDLTCTASGASVTFDSNIGASSFQVVFSATPQAVGTFQNPRSGGTAQADPNNVIVESAEGNNAVTPNNTVTVTAASTTTTIGNAATLTSTPSVVGEAVTVQWSVTVNSPGSVGTALTGNVTVSAGADNCVASVSAGQCNLTFTTAGPKTIDASYAGDTNYNGSSTVTDPPHTVNAANTTTTITEDNPDPSTPGQAVLVKYTVTVDSPGSGTPTGTVTVSDGVDSNNTCTVADGAAGCSLTLNTIGNRTITATYVGNSNFNTSNDTESHQVCGTGTVTTNADSGAGSLRQVIADACEDSTISFAIDPGAGPHTITLTTGELVLNKNLTIRNTSGESITVSGNNASRVFNINSGKTVTIINLTISGGQPAADGGGIKNDGTLTLKNSTVSGNATTQNGAGIHNSNVLNVVNSTISGNTSSIDGGGLVQDGVSPTLYMVNSTVSGNTANGFGGGLDLRNGTVTILNSTITLNHGDNDNGSGGGAGGLRQQTATVTIRNTIVAGNYLGSATTTANDIEGTVSGNNNLIGDAGTAGGLTNGVNGNIVGAVIAAVLDTVLANNGGPTQTHRLITGSAAIDAGENASVPTDTFDADDDANTGEAVDVDQRGPTYPRIADSADANTTQTLDIGAFELHPSIEDIGNQASNENTVKNVTFNLGDDTGSLISTVTATSSNTTLVPNNIANLSFTGSGGSRTLQITPATNQSGSTTITVTVTATNGRTASDTFDLTVNAVNDPPAGTDNTVSTAEDTAYTFTAADFGFTDPNDAPPNTLLAVKITTLPGVGTLTNNNVPVNAGDFIPVADINGGLLKFTPVADANGTPYASFTFQVQDNGGGSDLDPTPNTMTINVTAVNDPPSFTIAADPPAVNQDAGAQTVLNFATSISSGPNESQVLTFNLSPTGTTGTLTFSGTPAINATTGTLTYTATNGTNGTATFSVTLSDNGSNTPPNSNTSGAQSFTITVNAPNATPVVTATAGNLAYSENDPATAIDPGLTVTDSDDANLVGASVAITAGFVSTQDTLAFTNQLGIIGIYDSGTGVLTLTGTTTVANYQTALRTVTYQNTSENPTASRTVTFTATDGISTAGSATRGIAITAVNDGPVNTVPGPQSTNEDTAKVFSSGNANQISVADVDAGSNPIKITLTATNGTVTLSGTAGLTFTPPADGTDDAIMVFTGTLTAVNTALNGLSFNPTADFSGAASLQIVSDDQGNTGTGGPLTDTDTINITVDAQNDAPVVTTTVANLSYTENDPATAIDPGLTVTDVDNPNLVGATVAITSGFVAAQDTLAFTNQLGITGNYNSGTGVLTLTGTTTVANYQTALRSVTYQNSSDDPTASRTVTFTADDGSNPGSNTRGITISAVNDGPVNTVPGPLGTAQNTPLVFSSGNGNQVSVADADAGTNAIQVTLTVTNGTLTLSGTSGLNFACGGCAGDGTADATMTFQGSLVNINTAMNGMTFTPTLGFSGAATLNITSNDLGNTGTGGPLSDGPDTVNITVSSNISVNDASVAEPVSPNTVDMVFTVSLQAPAPGPVSVNFTTQDQAPAINHAVAGTCGNPGADYVLTSGTVSFTTGQQVKTINVPICSDSASEPDETFEVVLSSPSGASIADGTAIGTIKSSNTAGPVVISELRTSGPGGAGDDFVEIYNNTNSPLTVTASDASAGYGLYKMGADCNATPILIGVIPNGTVIPARGHYLFVGSAYSLANYGGTGAAAGNLLLSADIETDANVGLFSSSLIAGISSVNRLDAVGFGVNTGGTCNLLREGTTLPPIAANATLEHSYFRKMCDWIPGFGCTVPGIPKDTNDNSVDFWLVDTAASAITGRLGAPGPENLASPIRRDSANNPGSGGISVFLLDGTVGSAFGPNRARNSGDPAGTFGSMTLRYRVTNNTGGNVTRLRYRVVDMSTAIQPAGLTADLRALTSSTEPSVGPVNDSVTCTAGGAGAPPCTVTVTATTLEAPPNQAIGGGYNSTLSSGTITTGTPLGSGNSILINFKLGVEKTGQFRFYIIVEALP